MSNTHTPKVVNVFGATGSIGSSTMSVIAMYPDYFKIGVMTAHRYSDSLLTLARQHIPDHIIVSEDSLDAVRNALCDLPTEIHAGQNALVEGALVPCDISVIGITGMRALSITANAIKQGNIVALASKECLVSAGTLLLMQAVEHKTTVIPIDSEHHGLFRLIGGHSALNPDSIQKVSRIGITASGGSFWHLSYEEMRYVTKHDAITHPKWSMGEKISVDSATMMNKALEIIEANVLFPISIDSIDVAVHTQALVHAFVTMKDGSMLMNIAQPDMRIPIAYALFYPEYVDLQIMPVNLISTRSLVFEKEDSVRFPALQLGRDVMRLGGLAGVVMNAANEIFVRAFLDDLIGFLDIVPNVVDMVDEIAIKGGVCGGHVQWSLDEILHIDQKTRVLSREVLQCNDKNRNNKAKNLLSS